jgi:hypothetical protein
VLHALLWHNMHIEAPWHSTSILRAHVQVGLKIAAKAGFNIDRAPAVWDDFARQQGPGSGALAVLSTHPASSSRKKALLREIEDMKQMGWSKGQHAVGSMLDSMQPAKGYCAL